MKTAAILFLTAITLASCGKGNERLKEQAKTEGEALREVENSNQAQKAEAMESDLTRRHRFYQAVKGQYEGTITTSAGLYNIRITLTPSLSPLRHNRVRQLDEITSDLNNLTLNTQIVQWDPNSLNSAVGCRVSNVRPDIEKGEITISSESCSNLYKIKISERDMDNSVTLAKNILNGNVLEVDTMKGLIHPSTNASIFNFSAFRVQE